MRKASPKENLLFLSAHLPAPNATQAGQLTAFRNLDLLHTSYNIHLITFRTEVESDWSLVPLKERCTQVEVFDVSKRSRALGALQRPQLPLIIASRASSDFRRSIETACRTAPPARVHMEWTQIAQYKDSLPKNCLQTLSIYDVLTQAAQRKEQLSARLRKLAYRVEAGRIYAWEKKHLGQFDKIFVPSAKDRNLYADLGIISSDRVAVLPLAFNVIPARASVPTGPFKIAYWGSYARQENVDAALFLLDGVLPALDRLGLKAQVLLIGANPPPALLRRASDRVTVTGFVADPAEMLTSAHLAVLPLRMGAGVKVKVLECLSGGIPVVTTSTGAEGIACGPEEGLVTVDGTAEAMARKVWELAKLPAEIERLSASAAIWAQKYAATDNTTLLML